MASASCFAATASDKDRYMDAVRRFSFNRCFFNVTVSVVNVSSSLRWVPIWTASASTSRKVVSTARRPISTLHREDRYALELWMAGGSEVAEPSVVEDEDEDEDEDEGVVTESCTSRWNAPNVCVANRTASLTCRSSAISPVVLSSKLHRATTRVCE